MIWQGASVWVLLLYTVDNSNKSGNGMLSFVCWISANSTWVKGLIPKEVVLKVAGNFKRCGRLGDLYVIKHIILEGMVGSWSHSSGPFFMLFLLSVLWGVLLWFFCSDLLWYSYHKVLPYYRPKAKGPTIWG